MLDNLSFFSVSIVPHHPEQPTPTYFISTTPYKRLIQLQQLKYEGDAIEHQEEAINTK